MSTTETPTQYPAPVAEFLASPKQLFIDGEFVDAADGRTFPSIDPSTGDVLVEIAEAGQADVDRAVASARAAFEGEWSQTTPRDRETLILRLAELIAENVEHLAWLESLDSGKLLTVARDVEMPASAEHFRYFAGWATKIQGSTLPVSIPEMHVYAEREPVGVVAAIVPWNFPLLLTSWKVAPALAAGCTIVIKPAEETPLTALCLAQLAAEAGLPPGVLNVCTGDGPTTGAALAAHPDVDKVAFTGSTEVGRSVLAASASNLKQVSLELGGKSPNIVLPDADVTKVVDGAAAAIFYNSGQVCSAGSRLMVHDSVFDDVVAGVTAKAEEYNVGPSTDEKSTLGPLVSDAQFSRVMGYIEAGTDAGAELSTGGGRPEDRPSGYFVSPTVMVDVDDEARVTREEIFGPVLVAQRFESLEEVAARANDTVYGLAAGIWTESLGSAHKLASLLRAGSVWINCYGYVDPTAPFGGYKQSGYGRDGGFEALDKYLQTKTVWTNLG